MHYIEHHYRFSPRQTPDFIVFKRVFCSAHPELLAEGFLLTFDVVQEPFDSDAPSLRVSEGIICNEDYMTDRTLT